MTIEIAKNLISAGNFDEALDSQWDLISSGDEEARLDLAYFFDELGLHYFSQDQYIYLMENQPEFAPEAAAGAVANYVWLREYAHAIELLDQYPQLPASLRSYVRESELEHSTLSENPELIELWVSQAMGERDLIDSNFASNHSLENLKAKLYIEELLLNLAVDISQNPNTLISNMSLEIPIAVNTFVPRSLSSIVGNPVDRARDYLRTCALVILNLFESNDEDLLNNSSFIESCIRGKKVAIKFLWLMNEFDYTEEDAITLGNICWGLERMPEMNDKFTGGFINSYIQAQISDLE